MTDEQEKWDYLCDFIYQTEWSNDQVQMEVKAAAMDWKDVVERREKTVQENTLKFIQEDIDRMGVLGYDVREDEVKE